jgi:hypothetical protein
MIGHVLQALPSPVTATSCAADWDVSIKHDTRNGGCITKVAKQEAMGTTSTAVCCDLTTLTIAVM